MVQQDINIIENTYGTYIQSVTNTIYKYLPLNGDLDDSKILGAPCDDSKLSLGEMRIRNLHSKELWFSKWCSLNDPYEMQGFSYSKGKFKGMGACQDLNNSINRECIAIASFSKSKNNLPLWAHYANNHQGFCLDFEITSPQYIFPVHYQEERREEYIYSPFTVSSKKEEEYWGMQLSKKAKAWEYEEEMRILIYQLDTMRQSGRPVKYERIGLKLKKIIIGANCSEKNKKILKAVAQSLGTECSQAYLSNKKYEIYDRKVLLVGGKI